MADKRLQAATGRLGAWAFWPSGTEGFAKAEVTEGMEVVEAINAEYGEDIFG